MKLQHCGVFEENSVSIHIYPAPICFGKRLEFVATIELSRRREPTAEYPAGAGHADELDAAPARPGVPGSRGRRVRGRDGRRRALAIAQRKDSVSTGVCLPITHTCISWIGI